jgi:hypothetical protein
VRDGADVQLSSGAATYREMLLQVARDYAGLPDPRTLTVSEIVFFFEGLRPELKKYTGRQSSTSSMPKKPRKRR